MLLIFFLIHKIVVFPALSRPFNFNNYYYNKIPKIKILNSLSSNKAENNLEKTNPILFINFYLFEIKFLNYYYYLNKC